MTAAGRVGVYPGSFNPPTVAHLAIAAAARHQAGLERVDLVVSESALGKEGTAVPTLEDRLDVLAAVVRTRPWLGLRRTTLQFLADIAEGYAVLVVGADKFAQLVDPVWYGSAEARDRAVARLPPLLVVDRPGYPSPPAGDGRWTRLHLDDAHAEVSSTGARAGRIDWMLPEAAAWDARTGAWSDPDRYRAGHPRGPGGP